LSTQSGQYPDGSVARRLTGWALVLVIAVCLAEFALILVLALHPFL
jgi:hypothetical protein